MPYLTNDKREPIDAALNIDQLKPLLDDAGNLNYILTTIITTALVEHGTNYAAINNIMGVLECIKTEFYARVAQPYEALKKMENGDVPNYKALSDMVMFNIEEHIVGRIKQKEADDAEQVRAIEAGEQGVEDSSEATDEGSPEDASGN